jgi:uncharacterized protein GlcG (DUF336 family)
MTTARHIIFAVIAISLPLSAMAKEDKQPLYISVKRLSLETALTIAKTALDKCRKEGMQVAVTVVDRGGDTQVVLRDVLAPELALTISKQKAYSAMSFNMPTSELEKRGASVGKVEGVLFAAGGLPIAAAGTSFGGIGVSGAPSGEIDERCAKAGLDSVLDTLEMAE